MRRWLWWVLMVSVAWVVVAVPSSAVAGTTIGQTPTPNATCSNDTFVQESEARRVPSYAVPAGGGVITSWSTMAGPSGAENFRFKVFRPTGDPDEYTVLAADSVKTLSDGSLNTFPVRIAVEAGDRLGGYTNSYCGVRGLPGNHLGVSSGDWRVCRGRVSESE
jgi:hypothetical protein